MPSRLVDEAWHAFILDSVAYMRFCDAAFGRESGYFGNVGLMNEGALDGEVDTDDPAPRSADVHGHRSGSLTVGLAAIALLAVGCGDHSSSTTADELPPLLSSAAKALDDAGIPFEIRDVVVEDPKDDVALVVNPDADSPVAIYKGGIGDFVGISGIDTDQLFICNGLTVAGARNTDVNEVLRETDLCPQEFG